MHPARWKIMSPGSPLGLHLPHDAVEPASPVLKTPERLVAHGRVPVAAPQPVEAVFNPVVLPSDLFDVDHHGASPLDVCSLPGLRMTPAGGPPYEHARPMTHCE